MLNRFYNQSATNTGNDYYLNRIRTADFLVCAFALGGDPSNAANACLDQNMGGDYWSDIHWCASGPEGAALYTEMGRQTGLLVPPLTSAPVVTLGGSESSNALINFFQALCNSYGVSGGI